MTDQPTEPTGPPPTSENSYAFPEPADSSELVWQSSPQAPRSATIALSEAARRRQHLDDNPRG